MSMSPLVDRYVKIGFQLGIISSSGVYYHLQQGKSMRVFHTMRLQHAMVLDYY